jgi:hypothetical protein
MIRAAQMTQLDVMIGGVEASKDARHLVLGGGSNIQLVGGRAKWHLQDKLLRLQHLVDTSNTRELELLRVVGNRSTRVHFSRATYDDTQPEKQPVAADAAGRHAHVMGVLRDRLARDESAVVTDAVMEYDLVEPLRLAVAEMMRTLTPYVARRAPADRLTPDGRIKIGPALAGVVEQLCSGAAMCYDGESAASAVSVDIMAPVETLLEMLPPDLEGKWQFDGEPPGWPAAPIVDVGLPARRAALEADAVEHEPRVSAGEECPCLISRRFALAILEIEAALEPHITAIEDYYVLAAEYIAAMHMALTTWLRSAAQPKRHAKKRER